MPSAAVMLKFSQLCQLVETALDTMPELLNRLRTEDSLIDVLVELDPEDATSKDFLQTLPRDKREELRVAIVETADQRKPLYPAYHRGQYRVWKDDIGEYVMLTLYTPDEQITPEIKSTSGMI